MERAVTIARASEVVQIVAHSGSGCVLLPELRQHHRLMLDRFLADDRFWFTTPLELAQRLRRRHQMLQTCSQTSAEANTETS